VFGQVGTLEIVVVLVIALVVLGPKRLPEVARSVGRGVRELREAMSGAGGDDDEDDEDEPDHITAEKPPGSLS
jgi:sec-independent protein translocase protein TatA